VTRALALEPSDPEAQSILGFISMVYDWDWVGGERALARSTEVSPGMANPRNLRTSLFMALRRFPEAVAEAETYRRLDPASASAVSTLGRARYRARQFDQAIKDFQEAIALDPTYGPSYARLADVYMAQGRHADAIAALERGQRVLGGTRRQLDGFATAYALAGRRREAEALRDEMVAQSRNRDQVFYSLAMVDVALGNHDAAFEWLNRAFEARSANLWLVNSEIKFDPIRSDPRFVDLLRRMGLQPR
jgi:tetratricopeptide (TPR) repeat protein